MLIFECIIYFSDTAHSLNLLSEESPLLLGLFLRLLLGEFFKYFINLGFCLILCYSPVAILFDLFLIMLSSCSIFLTFGFHDLIYYVIKHVHNSFINKWS